MYSIVGSRWIERQVDRQTDEKTDVGQTDVGQTDVGQTDVGQTDRLTDGQIDVLIGKWYRGYTSTWNTNIQKD